MTTEKCDNGLLRFVRLKIWVDSNTESQQATSKKEFNHFHETLYQKQTLLSTLN